jgi:hypothetical protein
MTEWVWGEKWLVLEMWRGLHHKYKMQDLKQGTKKKNLRVRVRVREYVLY